MKTTVKLAFLFIVCALVGCATSKCVFLDPTRPLLNAENLKPTARPQPVAVTISGRVPIYGAKVREDLIVNTLKESRLFSEINTASNASAKTDVAQLIIRLDNHSGQRTWRTSNLEEPSFDRKGAMVCGHECTVTYQPVGQPPFHVDVKDAFYIKSKGPDGAELLTLDEAYSRFVRQMTLQVLAELQKQGCFQ